LSFSFSVGAQYEYLLVEARGQKKNVGFIQLNRPKALNALCDGLMFELSKVLDTFEKDPQISCVVLTGSDRSFAGWFFNSATMLVFFSHHVEEPNGVFCHFLKWLR
jgi:1,4-dihydroxy-2-naphthoyl-CoA synthase